MNFVNTVGGIPADKDGVPIVGALRDAVNAAAAQAHEEHIKALNEGAWPSAEAYKNVMIEAKWAAIADFKAKTETP
jgi:hypothetical protein